MFLIQHLLRSNLKLVHKCISQIDISFHINVRKTSSVLKDVSSTIYGNLVKTFRFRIEEKLKLITFFLD